MPALPTPTDLGFAEFVAALLTETFDSVAAAQASQEERRTALIDAAELEQEDFAAVHVLDDEVDAALVADGHDPDDLDDDLRAAMRARIGARRQSALRASAQRGIPRIMVDTGRINAKLDFRAVSISDGGDASDEEASGDATTGGGTEAGGASRPPTNPRFLTAQPLLAGRLGAGANIGRALPELGETARIRPPLSAAIPAAISDLRLQVRPASADGAGGNEATARVLGEVEITFRTVD